MGKISERVQRARDTGRPVGAWSVQIRNERTGRIAEEFEQENYITELWEKFALSSQFGNYYLSTAGASDGTNVYNGSQLYTSAGAPFRNRMYGPGVGIPIPMDSVICTDWDSPEDPGVHWGRGRVTAWATRWKSTVNASGLRGIVNEAECLFTNNGLTHKTVWDWTTSQGNGTFQTVMLGGVVVFGNPAVQGMFCNVGPESIVFWNANYPNVRIYSNIWIEGTTAYWIGAQTNSATSNLRIFSMAVSDLFEATRKTIEPWVRDASAATVTDVCATGLALGGDPTTTATSASPYRRASMGLIKLGAGDFCITWIGTNGVTATSANGRRLWFRRISTAGTQVVANVQFGDTASNNAYFSGSTATTIDLSMPAASVSATYDGTFMYAHIGCGRLYGTGMKDKIYRVNVADGTLSTTINYPTDYTSCTEGGICLHDGDLLVSTRQGIIRLDTGGVPVYPYNYGSIVSGDWGNNIVGPFYNDTETALAPWATTADLYQGDRGQYGVTSRLESFGRAAASLTPMGNNTIGASTGGSTIQAVQKAQARGTLVAYGDDLYVTHWGTDDSTGKPQDRAVSSGNPGLLWRVNGANMLSRVRLSSPATKGSAQTMKISYEITFPSPYDLNRIPGPNDLTESTGPGS